MPLRRIDKNLMELCIKEVHVSIFIAENLREEPKDRLIVRPTDPPELLEFQDASALSGNRAVHHMLHPLDRCRLSSRDLTNREDHKQRKEQNAHRCRLNVSSVLVSCRHAKSLLKEPSH